MRLINDFFYQEKAKYNETTFIGINPDKGYKLVLNCNSPPTVEYIDVE